MHENGSLGLWSPSMFSCPVDAVIRSDTEHRPTMSGAFDTSPFLAHSGENHILRNRRYSHPSEPDGMHGAVETFFSTQSILQGFTVSLLVMFLVWRIMYNSGKDEEVLHVKVEVDTRWAPLLCRLLPQFLRNMCMLCFCPGHARETVVDGVSGMRLDVMSESHVPSFRPARVKRVYPDGTLDLSLIHI